jgi:hypothetical protein
VSTLAVRGAVWRIRERPWTLVTAFAFLIALSVLRIRGPHHTLEPGYTDHMRHEYAAWAFIHIGPRVWDTPLGHWHVHALHAHRFWELLPEYYPPGLLLLFLPFGVASNLGWIKDTHVHLLMVAALGAAAVFAGAQLIRTLRLNYEPAFALVLGIFGATIFVTWALDGFIDPVAAGLALAGIYWVERNEPGRGLIALSGALSVHFRIWYLWPLVIAVAARNWRRIRLSHLAVSAVLLASSLVAFGLAEPAVSKLGRTPGRDTNYLALANGMNGERAVALVGAVALIVIVLFSKRSITPAACIALAMALIFGVNQWEAWYPVLLLPLFAVVRHRWSQVALTLAFMQLLVTLSGFTSVIRTVHLYVNAIKH